jgi:hypothetical protein
MEPVVKSNPAKTVAQFTHSQPASGKIPGDFTGLILVRNQHKGL